MILDCYVARKVLRSFLQVVLALVAIFGLFDFVDQLEAVGRGHYQVLDALTYILLTSPSRLPQATPVAVLLGSLLALGALAKNSELTALRSLGVSEGRVAGALIALFILVFCAELALAQFLVPPAQLLATSRREAALSTAASAADSGGLWAQSHDTYLHVQDFDAANMPTGVELYTFAPDGTMISFIQASAADVEPDGSWQLKKPARWEIKSDVLHVDYPVFLSWKPFITTRQLRLLTLAPQNMPPVALLRHILFLRRSQQNASIYEQALSATLGLPLVMIAMVLLAVSLTSRVLPRGQSAGRQIFLGATIGVVFSLFQQLLVQLGLLLGFNPIATSLAPACMLFAAAFYLFNTPAAGGGA